MLFTFTSSTAGHLFMLSDSAQEILALLDKEASTEGVITLEQLPGAIQALTEAMARAHHAMPPPATVPAEAFSDEPVWEPVNLASRIMPLRDYLARTLKEEGYVTWCQSN